MKDKLLAPILSGEEELILIEEEELDRKIEREEEIRDVIIRNVRMSGKDISRMQFSASIFENCLFQDCSFEKGEFTDVVFRSCDFSNCGLEDCYFNRTEFISSKGVGTRFCGSTILHTRITDCNFHYANFDSSKMEHIYLTDVQLEGGFLTQCRMKDLLWNQVNLDNASFFKTMLKGMDFTTCTIHGLVLSDECTELKGAVVDLYQAAELAKYLGVVVKS